MAMRFRKGDQVMVTAGSSKGRRGTVLRIDAARQLVYIQGVNMKRKHLRPTQANPQGGVTELEGPVHISNVSPIAGEKPTRVRYQTKENGKKVRVAARNGEELSVIKEAQ